MTEEGLTRSAHRTYSRRNCTQSILSGFTICGVGIYGFARGAGAIGWILMGFGVLAAASGLWFATRKIIVTDTRLKESCLLKERSISLSCIEIIEVVNLGLIGGRTEIVSVRGEGKRFTFTSATEDYAGLMQHLRDKAVNAELKGFTLKGWKL